jgi:hypothetical protein
MIHTVRKPFMCRKGQFNKHGYLGQVLVVGIDVNALKTNNPYRFKIGKSPRIYSGDSSDALAVAYIWHNRAGRAVAIVPVDFFQEEEHDDVHILSLVSQAERVEHEVQLSF